MDCSSITETFKNSKVSVYYPQANGVVEYCEPRFKRLSPNGNARGKALEIMSATGVAPCVLRARVHATQEKVVFYTRDHQLDSATANLFS